MTLNHTSGSRDIALHTRRLAHDESAGPFRYAPPPRGTPGGGVILLIVIGLCFLVAGAGIAALLPAIEHYMPAPGFEPCLTKGC